MRARAFERPTNPLELFGVEPAAEPERMTVRGDRVVIQEQLTSLRADVRLLSLTVAMLAAAIGLLALAVWR